MQEYASLNYRTISPQSLERIKGALEEAAAEDVAAIAAPTTNGVLNVNGITNGVNGVAPTMEDDQHSVKRHPPQG